MGGVATWLDYLLPELEELGWESSLGLVAGRFHDPERYLEQHPYHRVIRIPNPTGSQEGRIRALCGAVQKVDPAMVLSVNIPDAYLSMARLRRRGRSAAKTVMTLHGIQADLLGDAHAFRSVLDAVVCTNRLTCQLVEESAGVAPERIHYAPYGVEVGPADARSKPPSASGSIRVAWVGRLDETQKRVSDIPRILQTLDGMGETYELWVVGSGPEEAPLRDRLTPWISDGRVRMLGALPRQAVCSEIYDKVDALLLTSSWETGPIVLWEAMSRGLPVVTSEYTGSGPEGSLVNGENCLMYPVGDVARAGQCVSMLRNPGMHEKLSAGGMCLVRARYSIEASVTAWDTVLRNIACSESVGTSSTEFVIESRGRLDRLFGISAAEAVRRFLGIRHLHAEAGGEWPHSLVEANPSKSAKTSCWQITDLYGIDR